MKVYELPIETVIRRLGYKNSENLVYYSEFNCSNYNNHISKIVSEIKPYAVYFIDGNPYGHLIWGDGNHPLGEWIDTVVRRGYKGYFGQEITDFDYFEDPASHDKRNMEAYKPYLIG